MTKVRGCEFPDQLYYDVPNHTWYQPVDSSLVRAGMTQVGVALAREVLVFTPKRVGVEFEKNRAFAIVESAKWAGSVRAGFDGKVEAVNENLILRPTIVNEDCYGEGWMVLLRPSGDDWKDGLVTGNRISEVYEAWMEKEAFPGCGKR